ncbi:uncharacterized protein [Drosophila tropicalis]|uniref:uncharacterized protein n=1 Tax=Drosophila tropicalis TaxID=46794 RepID=UPI0035ABBE02
MSSRKYALLLFYGISVFQVAFATEKCNYCRGINCQRSTYQSVEECSDKLDTCASVFHDGVIHSQGCLESLEDHCDDASGMKCVKCAVDNCNNKSLVSCVQCVDSEDVNCRSNPETLTAKSCGIARSGRNFCSTIISDDGQHVERGCVISLAEQINCLNNANCYLCDPVEKSSCNNHLVEGFVDTTEAPSTSTTSTSSPGESTQETTAPTVPTANPTTVSPEPSPTTTENPGGGGGGAGTLTVSLLLILAHLALYF